MSEKSTKMAMQNKELWPLADVINEALTVYEDLQFYIDRLIAKGRNLAEFNEALRKKVTQLEKDLSRFEG